MSEEYNFNKNENGYENSYQSNYENTYENPYGTATGNGYYGGNNPNPKNKNKRKVLAVIAATLAGVFLVGSIGVGIGRMTGINNTNKQQNSSSNLDNENTSGKENGKENKEENQTEAPHYTLSKADSIDTTNIVQATVLDVSNVVEEVMPSVVAIVNTFEYSNGFQTSQSPSSGTGVILAQDETEILVVTNAHVVDEESTTSYYYTIDSVGITVTFNDGTSVDAYVKGVDEEADLAVIAIKLEDITEETLSNIKVASIGNSTELKMGNGVIAIGNALGYGQSVTVGYVSALNREVTFSDGYTRNLIQIDAAINPGNSGGGLFDVYGRLIGINESKTVSEEVEGIGFAIPITEVEAIITELMNTVPRTQYSEEERGYMGISSMSVPSNYVSSGYPKGAVVVSIIENSPAAEAGLQLQDIIVAINDKEVSSSSELINELSYYKVGETITIQLMRIEKNRFVEEEVTITLGDKKVIEEEKETVSESQPIVIPGF